MATGKASQIDLLEAEGAAALADQRAGGRHHAAASPEFGREIAGGGSQTRDPESRVRTAA